MSLATYAGAQGAIQQPGQIQQPKGTWQKPGEIQQPKGPWQVPKGIQAVHQESSKCEQRLTVVADALFDFNSDKLNPDSEQTLDALGPAVKKMAGHPTVIEGHTDGIGSDTYNQALSERRAAAVQSWLVAHGFLAPGSSQVKGFGKTRPIAPNTNADGSDNPAGRQKNRRVVVVVNTCTAG
ncbi:MAG: OmpA family protein [Acidobacteriales bacterium]|nr:OmpA family protein [Terriglobales bacterium]